MRLSRMCDNIQFGMLEGQRELRPASEGRRGYRDKQGPWIHCLVLLIRGQVDRWIGPWNGEAESCHGCIVHRKWGSSWMDRHDCGGVKGRFRRICRRDLTNAVSYRIFSLAE